MSRACPDGAVVADASGVDGIEFFGIIRNDVDVSVVGAVVGIVVMGVVNVCVEGVDIGDSMVDMVISFHLVKSIP